MPKVKIIQISEESLHNLGLVLRNNSCVKIIILLSTEKLTIGQIAKKLHIGINVTSNQVKVLKKLGLLKITIEPLARKGIDRNFYEFVSDIFISTVPEPNKIKSIFKETVKFASIIVAGTVTYLSMFKERIITDYDYDNSIQNNTITSNKDESVILSLIVVIVGLLILYILEKRKNV